MYDSSERRSRATRHLAELRALNDQIEQLNAAKAGLLAVIVDDYTWPDQPDQDEPGPDQLRPITIAGRQVEEDLTAELSLAEKMSTGAAHYLVRDLVNLQTRQPLTWQAVTTAQVPLGVARRISDQVEQAQLDAAAAGRVDEDVAPLLGRIVGQRLGNAVRAAIMKADPDLARKLACKNSRDRFCRKYDTDDPMAGYISARLDKSDAIYLDAAVQRLADEFAAQGDDSSLDVRRAKALGLLANPARVIELIGVHTTRGLVDPSQAEAIAAQASQVAPLLRPPKVQLYVHCHVGQLDDPDELAHVEGLGPVFLDQVADLVGHAQVRVTPAIHLGYGDTVVDAYEVPDRIREHVVVRSRFEVFPYSSRPARTCDLDHTREFRPGVSGQTRPSNLGPLGRRVHRVKTHAGWGLEQPEPGVFDWTSPAGQRCRVGPGGAQPLTAIEQLQLWNIDRLNPLPQTA